MCEHCFISALAALVHSLSSFMYIRRKNINSEVVQPVQGNKKLYIQLYVFLLI